MVGELSPESVLGLGVIEEVLGEVSGLTRLHVVSPVSAWRRRFATPAAWPAWREWSAECPPAVRPGA